MQLNNENQEFKFSYSATEQSEIKRIRDKYSKTTESAESGETNENKMEKLRCLDASVSKKSSVVAIVIGVIGVLVFGFGMSLCMSDLGEALNLNGQISMLIGVIVGLFGCGVSLLAYPVYNFVFKREKKKITPEILSLTEELLK